MQIFVTDEHGFMVAAMFGSGGVEYAHDEGMLHVRQGESGSQHITITTNPGIFVEVLDEDGNVVQESGDNRYGVVNLSDGPKTLRIKTLPDPRLTPAELDAERRNVRRVVCSDMPYNLAVPDSLAGVIAWLQEKLKEIPEAYRDSAKLDTTDTWSHGESYANWQIEYTEPETDEEVVSRVKAARERERLAAHDELRTLQNLKAKYEPA